MSDYNGETFPSPAPKSQVVDWKDNCLKAEAKVRDLEQKIKTAERHTAERICNRLEQVWEEGPDVTGDIMSFYHTGDLDCILCEKENQKAIREVDLKLKIKQRRVRDLLKRCRARKEKIGELEYAFLSEHQACVDALSALSDAEDRVSYLEEDRHRWIDEMSELDKKVRELEQKLATLWHVCNVYDGNFARACDLVMDACAEYAKRIDGDG